MRPFSKNQKRNNKRKENTKRGGDRGSGSSEGSGFNNRSFNSSGFRGNAGGGGFQQREVHTVTCNECKKETTVPFKPTEGRPVYCRDCYQKHKSKE